MDSAREARAGGIGRDDRILTVGGALALALPAYLGFEM